MGPGPIAPDAYYDLRLHGCIPEGRCVYIQSGDPGDFDGYLIAVAGVQLQRRTRHLQLALVVPERRACADRTEPDVNAHEQSFSEEVLSVASRILGVLSPNAFTIRGPLNLRNVIPLKFIFSEPERYAPLLESKPPGSVRWRSVQDLADVISDANVSSVIMDLNGSIGYLPELLALAPRLGSKLEASGMPITIMAGILAEAEAATLRVPGRDPRSTMNAIYHEASVKCMLQMAQESKLPLLFVTNNVCNKILRFEDCEELSSAFGLTGLLHDVAKEWYGPHLKGKCVPFDWVSFVAMLLVHRFPGLIATEKRELWVGRTDASVLVLKDPRLPSSSIVEANMEDTILWGAVDSVVDVDKEIMLQLGQYVAACFS